MTHTLHRVGTAENLAEDYVFLCMPSKDINHVGSGPKLRRFFEIALKHNPVKIGDARLGNEYHQGSVEKILENVEDRAVIQAVFNNKEAVVAMMKDLKEEDIGLSVVLSGLADHVHECCSKSGLNVHTVNQSLGRWGKTEKLPPQHVLEITTMCGHAMVSVNLIEEMIEKVKKGRISAEKAAEELFKPCMCGIFNTDRAAKLITAFVESEK